MKCCLIMIFLDLFVPVALNQTGGPDKVAVLSLGAQSKGHMCPSALRLLDIVRHAEKYEGKVRSGRNG
jgi:hypothetical protein